MSRAHSPSLGRSAGPSATVVRARASARGGRGCSPGVPPQPLLEVGEWVVEGVQRVAGRDAETDGLVDRRVAEIDAGAVVAPVPEESDFQAAVDAPRELVAGGAGDCRRAHCRSFLVSGCPAEPTGSAPRTTLVFKKLIGQSLMKRSVSFRIDGR